MSMETYRRDVKVLGAHFNPFGLTHGSRKYPQKPRHAGDLINNITANENGTGFRRF